MVTTSVDIECGLIELGPSVNANVRFCKQQESRDAVGTKAMICRFKNGGVGYLRRESQRLEDHFRLIKEKWILRSDVGDNVTGDCQFLFPTNLANFNYTSFRVKVV